MPETLKALCPDCGPVTGEVDERYGFWTCEECGTSWLLAELHTH